MTQEADSKELRGVSGAPNDVCGKRGNVMSLKKNDHRNVSKSTLLPQAFDRKRISKDYLYTDIT